MRSALIMPRLTKCLCVKQQHWSILRNNSGTAVSDSQSSSSSPQSIENAGVESIGSDTISKAMGAYLRRAKEHQEFMAKEEQEFVFGRRHLANMMGKDPETFTQKDINEAIRYLFPSGLYDPKARPMMRPPQEIYPKQKAAQFDISGRPHHPFFYTNKPNFFYLLHKMVGLLDTLNKSVSIGAIDDETKERMDNEFGGSVWITKTELEKQLLEKISDQQYSEWIACMERVVANPNRYKKMDFIQKYRKPLAKQNILDELPGVIIEDDGSKKVFVDVCMRKSSRGHVTVKMPGTGIFNINGLGLDYFETMQSRELIITPLQLTGMLGQVDVEASVQNGGETGQAGCVRWGISQGIAALGADTEKLRLAGLLTRDFRKRERNKPGQDGARAKWTWKKR